MMKFEVIRSETVKPSSPTPHHLKHFKLSLPDQLAPIAYEPLILFYPYAHNVTLLKKSLSETLTRFYPFAGRIKGNIFIECHDEGVDFVEARVHGNLRTLLAHPDAEKLRELLPVAIESPKAGEGALLGVKVSLYGCSGLAIGVCMSRKLGDAASLSTFIMSWSASALGYSQALLPDFNASFRFPPMNFCTDHISATDQITNNRANNGVTKRFVFNASKISTLQVKAASRNVEKPTNSEAITALIWRCAAAAASRSSPKVSVLSQSVDIRKRVVPPLSNDTIGNLVGYFVAQANENELELQGLVSQLRTGLKMVSNTLQKGYHGFQGFVECFKEADDTMKLHVCTCLSDHKVLYEVNFGWGRPMWVTNFPSGLNRNGASLVGMKNGDGMEAWVTLSEEDMDSFEHDQELLTFAMVNPSVLEPVAFKSAL